MSVPHSRRAWLLLAVALALPALWPLLGPGYFLKAHDGPHSLFFLVEFHRAIADGAVVPRWCTDQALGYGYPTFAFYSPLAYYLAEGFHLAGMDIPSAVKATHAVAFLLGLLGMFRCAELFLGPVAGALAALAYAYAPYRLVDMYVRSALAESLALGVAPWALWAFLRLASRPQRARLAGAGFCFGLLLLAHNVTGLLCVPVLMALAIAGCMGRRHGRLRAAVWCTAGGVLGVCLAAMSLLPALLERQYIVEAQWTHATYELERHFVYLGQLFIPFWGYGYAVEGPADGMSFQLGISLLCLAAFGAGAWRRRWLKLGSMSFFITACVFLLLPASAPVWGALRPLALVQFPWRLLGPLVLCLALLSGGAARAAKGPAQAIVLLCLPVVEGLAYAQPSLLLPAERASQPVAAVEFELEYPDMRGMTAFAQQYPQDSPKVEAYLAGEPVPLASASVPGATVRTLHHGGHVQAVFVAQPEEGRVLFFTYYYPGWKATVDGRAVAIEPWGPLALIAVPVPAGEHVVMLRFGETPLRTGADCVSLGAGLLILFLALPPRRGITAEQGERRQC